MEIFNCLYLQDLQVYMNILFWVGVAIYVVKLEDFNKELMEIRLVFLYSFHVMRFRIWHKQLILLVELTFLVFSILQDNQALITVIIRLMYFGMTF